MYNIVRSSESPRVHRDAGPTGRGFWCDMEGIMESLAEGFVDNDVSFCAKRYRQLDNEGVLRYLVASN